MIPNITIKQNDTKIRFIYRPKIDNKDIPPADAAGATLKFLFANSSSNLARDAEIVPDAGNTYIEFVYDPTSEDVSQAGKFRQEWEMRTIDGKILTFPNNGYNIVEILPDLG